jgi:hypothetical protein
MEMASLSADRVLLLGPLQVIKMGASCRSRLRARSALSLPISRWRRGPFPAKNYASYFGMSPMTREASCAGASSSCGHFLQNDRCAPRLFSRSILASLEEAIKIAMIRKSRGGGLSRRQLRSGQSGEAVWLFRFLFERLGVIRDRTGRSCLSLNVRFAPKATEALLAAE